MARTYPVEFGILLVLTAWGCTGGRATPTVFDGATGGIDAAAGADAGTSDTNPDGPVSTTTCYQPHGEVAAIPACASTRLCTAPEFAIAVDATGCDGEGCRWTYARNLGDTLTYDGALAWVFLRFHGSIAGATTTQHLVDAFEHVNFYVKFPVSGGASGLSSIYFEQRTGAQDFERLELLNGRLHVRLTFTVKDPYAWISSPDSRCFNSDILGMCTCRYGGVSLPGTIDLDLRADLP